MEKQNSLIYDMLKSPAQVQEDELAKVREKAIRQQELITAQSSGDPIIDALNRGFAQANTRASTLYPRQMDQYAKAAGGLLGLKNKELGERVSMAGMSPEAREAAQTQQLIQGLDLTSVQGLLDASAKLETKRPDVALQLKERAKAMQSAQATAEAEAAQQTFENTIKDRETTATEMQAQAAMLRAMRPDTVINNMPQKIQTAFEEAEAEKLSTSLQESNKGAVQANSALKFSNEARRLLDSGVFTGLGANLQLKGSKVLNLLGVPVNKETIANTEAFGAAVGQNILSRIKAFGANPTEGERKFLQEISGADYTFTEDSLRQILRINDKYVRQAFDKQHNDIDVTVARFFDGDYKKAASQGYVKAQPEGSKAMFKDNGDVEFIYKGQKAVNPSTGEVLIFNGESWVAPK